MKNRYFLFLLFLISIFVHRNYLFENGYPSGMDSLGFYSVISYFSVEHRFLDIWSAISSGTGTTIPKVTSYLLAFFNYFINDTGLLLKIYFFGYTFISGISMYLFANCFFKNGLSAFVSALIYMFNKISISVSTSGHVDHMFAYMLLPLIFLYFKKYLDNGKFVDILKFSLFFSLVALTRFDPLLYISVGISAFAILNIIFFNERTLRNRVVNIYMVNILLFIIFTMYIWLPFSIVGTDIATITRSLSVVNDYSLNILDTILGYRTADGSGYLFWVGNKYVYDNIAINILMLFIPILSFVSFLILNKKDKYVSIFMLVAMIFIFLAKGPRKPFGDFYVILYNTLPFMDKITEPNRWLILTLFSYAMLVGFLVDNITNRTKSVIICLILICLVLTTPYIFIEGYQVSEININEKYPYVWLKNYNNRSVARVVTLPIQDRAFTRGGWLDHDIGKQSYAFHDMPVFYFDYGTNTRGSDFYRYSQNLILDSKIDDVIKMFGIFNVRYFILQGYPMTQPLYPTFPIQWRWTYELQDLFSKRDSLHEIYSGNKTNYTIRAGTSWANLIEKKREYPKLYDIYANFTPKIYESGDYVPRIFAPHGQILVIGGLESFSNIAEIDNFKFEDWNLLFANDMTNNIEDLNEKINDSDYIIFVNSNKLDMAMMLTSKIRINIDNPEKGSIGWYKDNIIVSNGNLVYNRDIISTNNKGLSKAIYSIDIINGLKYDIWMRALLHGKCGYVDILVDGDPIELTKPCISKNFDFGWIKIGEIELKKGGHKVEVLSKNGENSIDELILVERGKIDDALNRVQSIDKKSIYLIDIEKYNKNIDTGKNIVLYQNDKPMENIDIRTINNINNNVKYFEFKEVSPSKWVVKVNSTGPYSLIFSNSYHPMWRAYVNGKEYKSIPSYYFINSFQINETGDHEVIIEFIGQKIQYLTMLISGLMYTICVGYIFYDLAKKQETK